VIVGSVCGAVVLSVFSNGALFIIRERAIYVYSGFNSMPNSRMGSSGLKLRDGDGGHARSSVQSVQFIRPWSIQGPV